MSNCRWWIRGVSKFRVFKKKACTPFQHGVDFSWEGWNKEISEVRTLKPGDTIWNPYCNFWDSVKKKLFLFGSQFQDLNTSTTIGLKSPSAVAISMSFTLKQLQDTISMNHHL